MGRALIYKLKTFARFARDEGISDERIAEAIERADRGLIDADLGGNLIKQRLARRGQGRSGSFRVSIASRKQEFSLFLYGFAKRDRDNLDLKELRVIRELSDSWVNASAEKIELALAAGHLIEVKK